AMDCNLAPGEACEGQSFLYSLLPGTVLTPKYSGRCARRAGGKRVECMRKRVQPPPTPSPTPSPTAMGASPQPISGGSDSISSSDNGVCAVVPDSAAAAIVPRDCTFCRVFNMTCDTSSSDWSCAARQPNTAAVGK